MCEFDSAILCSCGCRMSLSWSRILPGGGRGTAPNTAALRFYSTLLQQLLAAGITPVVTLYHLDLPQALQVRMYCEGTPAAAAAAAAGPSWFPQRQPHGGGAECEQRDAWCSRHAQTHARNSQQRQLLHVWIQ